LLFADITVAVVNCFDQTWFLTRLELTNLNKETCIGVNVLAYCQVDENGKITRLRRECPNEDCGAGVFMASHFDRQYCGKCNLTYVFSKPDEKA